MPEENIFLSYRREDTAGYAGRLYDRLNARFPNRVFMDVTSIEAGADFVDTIEHAVGSCGAFILLIGENWLTVTDSGGHRRLDDPQDMVATEIAIALERNIRVIPALVGTAPMPTEIDLPPKVIALARRNALRLTDQDWDHDVERLIDLLERKLGVPSEGREGTSAAVPELAGRWHYVERRAHAQNTGILVLRPDSDFMLIDSAGIMIMRGRWEFAPATSTLLLFDPSRYAIDLGIGFRGKLRSTQAEPGRFSGVVQWPGGGDAWNWDITRESG